MARSGGEPLLCGWLNTGTLYLGRIVSRMAHWPPNHVTRRGVLRAIAASGALAASATVAACASTGSDTGQPQQRPPLTQAPSMALATPGTLVMIIRHGEKPDKDGDLPGVDSEGNPASDSSLSQIGWDRARRLVDVFDPSSSGQPRPGLARPKMIYAAGVTDAGEGVRTRETVTPLALRLRIPVNTSFGKGDEQALADQITSQPGPTLICWQHGEIPAIAQAFGSLAPAPPDTWPDDRFDVIWTLTATDSGWNFAQIPEMVLPYDQAQVISD